MTVRVTIPGEMRGKGRPRFARRGAHVSTYTDEATVSAEALVKICAKQAGATLLTGPVALRMQIAVSVPRSWSRSKRAAALAGDVRPTSKPDLDNCLKLVADALNGIAWVDDKQIVAVACSKHYAEAPETVLTIAEAAAFLMPAIPVEPLRRI